MKAAGNKPAEETVRKANIMKPTHPVYKTRATRLLLTVLRQLNPASLSVVMMTSLALLEATQGINSEAERPVADQTMMAVTADHVSALGLDASTDASGVSEFERRIKTGPCSGFSRPSACLP